MLAFSARPAAAQVPLCQTGCTGTYSVEVTPDNLAKARLLSGSNYVDTFTVTNTGDNSDTYSFSCSATGGITCVQVNPTSATIGIHAKGVVVTYSVSSPGGTLTLTASAHAMDTGSLIISANPTLTWVVPSRSGTRAVVATRQPLIRALFLPNGSGIDTTKTVLVWKHGASTDTVTRFRSDSLSVARQNRGLIEWEVDSTRWLTGRPDSALAKVTACALNGLCTSDSAWAVLPNDSTPILGFAGRPLEALGRQFGAPFGPGLSVSGADVETGIGIPAYVSLGAARSAGLVYSTRTSYPRALIPVDLELPWPSTAPTQIKLILFDGGVKLDSLVLGSGQTTCTSYGGAVKRCRAVLQGDFSGSTYSTPTRKWLTVQAQVTSGTTTKMISDSTEIVLVDRRATPYGAGWWPSAYVKLVAAGSDRLLVGPTGTAAIYRSNGDSLYLSPPGDVTTLVKAGTGWELHPRGTLAKIVFDASGRLQAAVDASGNRDSIAYSGSSDQITKFVDPVGKTITLAYDGSGKLATFTDPGSRQSKVSINGTSNQLTSDSVSSPTARAYRTTFVYQSYPGTNTVVLTKRIGVILDTTIVTYDSTFKRRPTQVRLAQVQDETGSTVNPVITYTAYERRGFGGLVYLDSTYVELKDPRNNWTRSLLNRWGEARKTWDALGTLGRADFSPDGLARWAEGKNGDSSRVHTTYDAAWRPVKTWFYQGDASHVMRTDSLVYDTSDQVVSRIDARGKRDSIVYDSLGRVTRTITPNGDTTKMWYASDGLLDSTRAPGSTASRRFTYHGTWKNVVSVYDESNTLVDTMTLDGLGRDSLRDSKIRVQVTDTLYQWQWRRVQPFFNVAGQTDSSRLVRTDNCNNPCTTPSWPGSLDTDSTRVQRVRHRFDRAGRDSLRLNDRNKAVLYLYDRLGRLVSRRPWTDSMAVKDSFVYDVAGNLKKTITRRGDTITTNYDSRNRDTLSVIPGVGTLRKTFGGALDQVTRLWYDSPVDSIGGVNAELRWAYDQRGRLKADTSYTGNTARATSRSYDSYERPSTMTDALGTWTGRYETARGYADTLVTPYNDTLKFVFDSRSRAQGPYILSGGARLNRVPGWNATGQLKVLSNTVQVGTAWTAGDWDKNDRSFPDDPDADLGPVWTEQHGSGAGLDSLQDSITYDGWERVLAWVQTKVGTGVVARDTFAFDRTGNVKTTAGAESYDVTTDRLLSMSVGGSTWSFTYDRAGNLVKLTKSATNDTLTYGYDALNHLRSVRRKGTLVARYGYDVTGRRIAKRVYSTVTGGVLGYTRFVSHGSAVAFETDSSGTIGLRYEWGMDIDDLIAIRDASGNHFYVVQDKLHSVRGLVKRDGTWVMSLRFGPYGATIDSSGSGPGFLLRYRWVGGEYDPETGWYYFRARYYDPAGRRFTQEDPIGFLGGQNLYMYVQGAPLSRRDPFGQDDEPDPTCVRTEGILICGAFIIDGLTASGSRSRDPFVEIFAREYVNWLISIGQGNSIGSLPTLSDRGAGSHGKLTIGDFQESGIRSPCVARLVAICMLIRPIQIGSDGYIEQEPLAEQIIDEPIDPERSRLGTPADEPVEDGPFPEFVPEGEPELASRASVEAIAEAAEGTASATGAADAAATGGFGTMLADIGALGAGVFLALLATLIPTH
jgi:RHS repeat-associated protein